MLDSAFVFRDVNWELRRRSSKGSAKSLWRGESFFSSVVQSAWGFGMGYSEYSLLLQKLMGEILSFSSELTRTYMGGKGG